LINSIQVNIHHKLDSFITPLHPKILLKIDSGKKGGREEDL